MMLREWKTEWMKVRRRGIGLLLLCFLGLTFVWLYWSMSHIKTEELADGYRMAWLNLSMVNTIFLPAMSAMLASRLCDSEIKGNTLKLLCTMEKKGRVFDMKLLTEQCYLAAYLLAEIGLTLLLGVGKGFETPMSLSHALSFLAGNYLVTLLILLLQTVLSFFLENQIIPLAIGLLGSFLGIFSWYMPPAVTGFLLPWGYYCRLTFIGLDWDIETRISTYFDTGMDWGAVAVLCLVLAGGYLLGRYLFEKKGV